MNKNTCMGQKYKMDELTNGQTDGHVQTDDQTGGWRDDRTIGRTHDRIYRQTYLISMHRKQGIIIKNSFY